MQFLCGDSDGTIGIYDLNQGAFTTRASLGSGSILDGTWADDKAVVATSSGAIIITQDGAIEGKLRQHAGPATAVATHPCGTIIASVGVDKSYTLYDVHNTRVLTQIFTDVELTTVKFHPDGHLIATGAADGSIKLYETKTSRLAHTFPPTANAPVSSLSFSENGTWLASAISGQTALTVWDLRKLSALKTLEIGTAVTGITWDYTGQFLAACGPGGIVVSQYAKSSKQWSEPLRKAINAVDVQWGARAMSLIALTGDGAVSVLRG